jgi:hypothetical protein
MQAAGFFITHVVSVVFGGVWSTDDSKCARYILSTMQFTAGLLLSISMGLGKIVWLVSGHVIRFRMAGKACSGDFLDEDEREAHLPGYLPRTGKFMTTWIFMEYGICVVSFLIVCLNSRNQS